MTILLFPIATILAGVFITAAVAVTVLGLRWAYNNFKSLNK